MIDKPSKYHNRNCPICKERLYNPTWKYCDRIECKRKRERYKKKHKLNLI